MATFTITGGTGMIGTAIAKRLLEQEHTVIILTRHPKPSSGRLLYKQWDVNRGTVDASAITEADYIIHLAGANVAAKRWTASRKKEIINSRVKTGELLVKALSTQPNHVQAVISASAQGWYGADPHIPNPRPFAETDPPDNGFLGRTCQQWEAAIEPVTALGKRLVILRIGIVLSNKGGAYPEFKKPLKAGLATILGSGRQRVSWIHINDLARLFITGLLQPGWNGVYNAVAPTPVPHKELILEIARQRRKFYLPVRVPAFALKLALGELSIEVLKSTTVSAQKTVQQGFHFTYPTLQKAVAALLHRPET